MGLLCLAVLLLPFAPPALALTVFAEGRVAAAQADPAVAQRSALAVALARAVEAVLERHVSPAELRTRANDVRGTFLARPSPYIQRYSISSEGTERGDFVVRVEAEVAAERVLTELRAKGFRVHQLTARPRLLVAPLGGPGATAIAVGLRRVLEAQGYVVRALPEAPSEEAAGEAQAARWARDLGCHVALLVTAAGPEDEPRRLPPEDAEGGPGTERDGPARSGIRAQGWIVDSRREGLLGQSEATAWGEGPDAVAATAQAARRAGERLGAVLLDQLEQSGWNLGDDRQVLDLVVEGLPGAALVEAIGRALPAVTEVRAASLKEVGYRSAVWRVDALDAGLGPEALLGALRLPRGRLAWLATSDLSDGSVRTVRAEWRER
ncbi:MAG: hypothetical protein AB1578_16015 [Thermodesulfobacteriota bacterium]